MTRQPDPVMTLPPDPLHRTLGLLELLTVAPDSDSTLLPPHYEAEARLEWIRDLRICGESDLALAECLLVEIIEECPSQQDVIIDVVMDAVALIRLHDVEPEEAVRMPLFEKGLLRFSTLERVVRSCVRWTLTHLDFERDLYHEDVRRKLTRRWISSGMRARLRGEPDPHRRVS